MQADQPSDASVKSSGPWLEGGSYGHLLTPPLPPIHIPAVLLALLTLLGNHAAAKTLSALQTSVSVLRTSTCSQPLWVVCPGGDCTCWRCPGMATRCEAAPTEGPSTGTRRTITALVTVHSNSLVETIILDKAPI